MKLIGYMPPYLKNVLEFIKIFDAEDIEVQNIRYLIDKMLKEVIVKTATSYGLDRYEKIYGIKNKAETIEARRMNILFKINNKVPYTLKWLINTLNESIGKDNYKLIAKDYELYITINLAYTEAAEMLKSNLIKQIPANIQLEYELETTLNEYIGGAISRYDYIILNAEAFEEIDDVVLNQNNNTGVAIINTGYIEIDPNTDVVIKNEDIDLNAKNGAKVSRQDYMNIDVSMDEKQEKILLNQNNNLGLNLVKQDYIEIEEVLK